MKLLPIFLTALFTGCIMPESYLKNSELYGIPDTKLIYNGKTVCLINETETGKKRIDENGVYKYEYQFQKVKNGYQVKSIKFYDSLGILLDTNSIMDYAQAITRWTKNGNIKEQVFLDNNGKLTTPNYIGYARQVRINKKNGSWIEKYYDSNNNPRCGEKGFIIEKKWDTIHVTQNGEKSYLLSIKILSMMDCNKKPIAIP